MTSRPRFPSNTYPSRADSGERRHSRECKDKQLVKYTARGGDLDWLEMDEKMDAYSEREEQHEQALLPWVNKGIPAQKDLIDVTGKWAALRLNSISTVEKRARSHLPWKLEAARRVGPQYLTGRV